MNETKALVFESSELFAFYSLSYVIMGVVKSGSKKSAPYKVESNAPQITVKIENFGKFKDRNIRLFRILFLLCSMSVGYKMDITLKTNDDNAPEKGVLYIECNCDNETIEVKSLGVKYKKKDKFVLKTKDTYVSQYRITYKNEQQTFYEYDLWPFEENLKLYNISTLKSGRKIKWARSAKYGPETTEMTESDFNTVQKYMTNDTYKIKIDNARDKVPENITFNGTDSEEIIPMKYETNTYNSTMLKHSKNNNYHNIDLSDKTDSVTIIENDVNHYKEGCLSRHEATEKDRCLPTMPSGINVETHYELFKTHLLESVKRKNSESTVVSSEDENKFKKGTNKFVYKLMKLLCKNSTIFLKLLSLDPRINSCFEHILNKLINDDNTRNKEKENDNNTRNEEEEEEYKNKSQIMEYWKYLLKTQDSLQIERGEKPVYTSSSDPSRVLKIIPSGEFNNENIGHFYYHEKSVMYLHGFKELENGKVIIAVHRFEGDTLYDYIKKHQEKHKKKIQEIRKEIRKEKRPEKLQEIQEEKRRQENLQENRRKKIVALLLGLIKELTKKHMVHGDLTLYNMIVTVNDKGDPEKLNLIDFGRSKRYDEQKPFPSEYTFVDLYILFTEFFNIVSKLDRTVNKKYREAFKSKNKDLSTLYGPNESDRTVYDYVTRYYEQYTKNELKIGT